MNGLDEIRVARESLQCGRLIPPEESSDGVLLRLQIGKVEPRQIILAVAPDPLKGVALGAIRWQAYEVHVVRQGKPLGRMCPTIVQEEDIQAVSKGLGEGIDEELEHVRIGDGSSRKQRSPVVGSTAPSTETHAKTCWTAQRAAPHKR